MKVIEITEWKDKWPMTCADMTANMRDFDNPQLPRYTVEFWGGGKQSQINQRLNDH